jgi:hypothetical protein
VKQVPAKTGILIMAPEGEYPVPTASVSSVYANMFRGTLEGTTIQTHEEIDGKDYITPYGEEFPKPWPRQNFLVPLQAI